MKTKVYTDIMSTIKLNKIHDIIYNKLLYIIDINKYNNQQYNNNIHSMIRLYYLHDIISKNIISNHKKSNTNRIYGPYSRYNIKIYKNKCIKDYDYIYSMQKYKT